MKNPTQRRKDAEDLRQGCRRHSYAVCSASPRLRVALLTLTFALPVAAFELDRNLPVRIDADRIEADQRQGVSRYIGNVVVTQGGLTIRAERAEVRAAHGGIASVAASGKPVQFERAATADVEAASGSADRIEFNAERNQLDAFGNVNLRQGRQEFSGATVRYSVSEQTVVVEGEPGRRVQVLFEPGDKLNLGKPAGGSQDPLNKTPTNKSP